MAFGDIYFWHSKKVKIKNEEQLLFTVISFVVKILVVSGKMFAHQANFDVSVTLSLSVLPRFLGCLITQH